MAVILPCCWFSAWRGSPRSTSPGIKTTAECCIYSSLHVGKDWDFQLKEREQWPQRKGTMELVTFSLCSILDVIRCNPCLDVRLLLSRTKNRWLLKETNLPCEVTNYTLMIVRRAKKTSVCIKHDRHILSQVLLCCVLLPLAWLPSHTPFLLFFFFLSFFFFFYLWHLLGACPSCDTILLAAVQTSSSELCMGCPEHTAFLMCDKTEPSHWGYGEGMQQNINKPVLNKAAALWWNRHFTEVSSRWIMYSN